MSRQELSENKLIIMGFRPSYALLDAKKRAIMNTNTKEKLRLKAEQLKTMKDREDAKAVTDAMRRS